MLSRAFHASKPTSPSSGETGAYSSDRELRRAASGSQETGTGASSSGLKRGRAKGNAVPGGRGGGQSDINTTP